MIFLSCVCCGSEKPLMSGPPWLLCLNRCHIVWQCASLCSPSPATMWVVMLATSAQTVTCYPFSLQFEDNMGSQKGVLRQECRLEYVRCWQRKLFCTSAGLVHVWDGMLCNRGHPHDKQAGSDPNSPCRPEFQFHCWAGWLLCCPV